ncbi:uncharacterized protein isoform X2 [Leptinotarsa decemlineata]|uniref:uncharacterized protein isoform X2 n=1 Tax=Leptinotarsa decemlineata TaxID=7539 RepID=UPI000C252D7D|nr:uncharacterized protein LOC111504583 isoform X2 [Leptinotarsa decemlineata]
MCKMACAEGALLGKLKALVKEMEGDPSSCPCPPACVPIQPNTKPFATCCMVCPPPILAPTTPEPVKPLQLPCPTDNGNQQNVMSDEEAERTRYANFYNNYNIDWHPDGACAENQGPYDPRKDKCKGVTSDGKNPCCEDYRRTKKQCQDKGCPTGFKPCTMKLSPPPNCHPCGVWCAEVQPCPPKSKKKKQPKNC